MTKKDYIDIIKLLSTVEAFARASYMQTNLHSKFLPKDISDEAERIIALLAEEIQK